MVVGVVVVVGGGVVVVGVVGVSSILPYSCRYKRPPINRKNHDTIGKFFVCSHPLLHPLCDPLV